MTDDATKLTQLLQPELAKPAEAADADEAKKKHRREELKARLAKDAAKAETASAAQAEQNKRRVEELKTKLAANPRFKGQGPARRSSCRAGCRRSRKAPPANATGRRRPGDASPAV